ncbi:MAG: GlsB/YeaQ/YmgE family stress response membrane protein [Candidatus Dojkabacteria bacterium]|jgi:uncharacterized membrane protein YeaQ/YmgE (transglycosylase-associated protein family)|nr:GlsB/YeaQ/YmgE family stress response membrane protein [Candidatus Dojkabacteria bacterium]MDD2270056.1 GlsB/YeaQ/YmgE family stress response membrane protein [Candidatus Dojkabacteria bacterium]
MGILIAILIGALAGWLAGVLIKGRGFGLIVNIIVGIVGSLIGQLLLDPLGIQAENFVGEILVATIGAVVLLAVINLIKKD